MLARFLGVECFQASAGNDDAGACEGYQEQQGLEALRGEATNSGDCRTNGVSKLGTTLSHWEGVTRVLGRKARVAHESMQQQLSFL